MGLATRDATIADVAAIATLLGELIASHDLPVPPQAQREEAVRRLLADERVACIVATDDGAVVGTVQALERFSTWANRRYGYLEDFVVAAPWRGRGVGALLVDHLRRLAAARDWVRIDLDTTADSRQARFYEREGFHDTGAALYRLDR